MSTVDCTPIRFAALREAARRTLTGAAALFVALLSMVSALGLFRASGFDVAGWLEGTAIGQLAKGAPEVGRMIDPEPLMGEPMPADWEMGVALASVWAVGSGAPTTHFQHQPWHRRCRIRRHRSLRRSHWGP